MTLARRLLVALYLSAATAALLAWATASPPFGPPECEAGPHSLDCLSCGSHRVTLAYRPGGDHWLCEECGAVGFAGAAWIDGSVVYRQQRPVVDCLEAQACPHCGEGGLDVRSGDFACHSCGWRGILTGASLRMGEITLFLPRMPVMIRPLVDAHTGR